jgi:capsular exopolysaccharide family
MIGIRKKSKKKQKKVPVLNEKTNFLAAEAYKTIRTNLLFTLQNHMGASVIITSTAPNEGKTTNCCNLGITLAQMNSKVLIIDCDLRKPYIHECFNKTCEPGLSEFLAGMKENAAEIIQDTEYPNLNVICGGIIPPNPAELLSSQRMEELIGELAEEYKYILMDTPPINLVADALSLSHLADGVVLVVKQAQTTHPELNHALTSLEFADARVLGVILNGIVGPDQYKYIRKSYKKYGY